MKVNLLVIGCWLLSSNLGAQTVEYYHIDGIGSVRVVTASTGEVVQRYDYLPFGEEWCPNQGCTATTVGQPRRFVGKERDTETSFDYSVARYYAASLGRFNTVDSVSIAPEAFTDPQRWNRYTYARGNPLAYADPDGRLTIIIPGTWARGKMIRARETAWARVGSPFNTVVSETFGEQARALEWTGSNTRGARANAARWLKFMIDMHTFEEDEPLNIVAHSHGGSVAKLYSQMPGARRIDTLVNLGTPQRPDYRINTDNVGDYFNVYSLNDDVQIFGGEWYALGQAFRKDVVGWKAINIDVTHLAHSHAELHTPRVWREVEKFILR